MTIVCILWTRIRLINPAEKNQKAKHRMKWKWLDISKTYAEEPLAHTSDEEEDTEEDSEDGLCPAVLQSRFEERLNCRIPCHSNNFPRSRLRVTQKVKFYSDFYVAGSAATRYAEKLKHQNEFTIIDRRDST